ncbi:surface lipoprotein assembly modifier [uncultured Sulfitobacter sp.]|uniref:surface lipoprotein assembly modifier n=1 Tax=uncultured Sulfitobacter sp. TaxID=191468 RepID=UPI00260E19B1|nr:surface lipoprotein assembly modifier [uncultured Sulfitobacter sp.]
MSAALWLALSGGAFAQAPQAQTDFNQARIMRASGEYKPAIEILRDLLRARPRDIAVREELGYALILDGQMAAAQYQFEILKERAPSADSRALYTAVLRRIVSERPVGISLIFGFNPTTNLNQGTDNTTLSGGVLGEGQIAPESRRISGWAGQIGLRGYVRGNLGAKGRITLDWRAARHLYSALYSAETETELGLTFATNTRTTDFSTRIFHLERQREKGDYSRTGVTIFAATPLAQGRQIDGTLQFSMLKMQQNPANDGLRTLLDLGYSRTPNPALSLRFGVQAVHADAARRALGFTSLAATAQASRAFRGGYEISGRVLAGQRRFNTDIGFSRHDSFADVSVTVFNSRLSLGGIVPKLTCSFAKTSSNVALFDATERACGLALSRRF